MQNTCILDRKYQRIEIFLCYEGSGEVVNPNNPLSIACGNIIKMVDKLNLIYYSLSEMKVWA